MNSKYIEALALGYIDTDGIPSEDAPEWVYNLIPRKCCVCGEVLPSRAEAKPGEVIHCEVAGDFCSERCLALKILED